MPIPAIFVSCIKPISYFSGVECSRGGATIIKMDTILLDSDVYTLVHNYLMLGYNNNENYNSRYAWKFPGVNTTSEPIPDNQGNITANAR